MCNCAFPQIYWGFQRFCLEIVVLRLIAHAQQECAKNIAVSFTAHGDTNLNKLTNMKTHKKKFLLEL